MHYFERASYNTAAACSEAEGYKSFWFHSVKRIAIKQATAAVSRRRQA